MKECEQTKNLGGNESEQEERKRSTNNKTKNNKNNNKPEQKQQQSTAARVMIMGRSLATWKGIVSLPIAAKELLPSVTLPRIFTDENKRKKKKMKKKSREFFQLAVVEEAHQKQQLMMMPQEEEERESQVGRLGRDAWAGGCSNVMTTMAAEKYKKYGWDPHWAPDACSNVIAMAAKEYKSYGRDRCAPPCGCSNVITMAAEEHIGLRKTQVIGGADSCGIERLAVYSHQCTQDAATQINGGEGVKSREAAEIDSERRRKFTNAVVEPQRRRMIANSKPSVSTVVSHEGTSVLQERPAWTFSLKQKPEVVVPIKPVIIAGQITCGMQQQQQKMKKKKGITNAIEVAQDRRNKSMSAADHIEPCQWQCDSEQRSILTSLEKLGLREGTITVDAAVVQKPLKTTFHNKVFDKKKVLGKGPETTENQRRGGQQEHMAMLLSVQEQIGADCGRRKRFETAHFGDRGGVTVFKTQPKAKKSDGLDLLLHHIRAEFNTLQGRSSKKLQQHPPETWKASFDERHHKKWAHPGEVVDFKEAQVVEGCPEHELTVRRNLKKVAVERQEDKGLQPLRSPWIKGDSKYLKEAASIEFMDSNSRYHLPDREKQDQKSPEERGNSVKMKDANIDSMSYKVWKHGNGPKETEPVENAIDRKRISCGVQGVSCNEGNGDRDPGEGRLFDTGTEQILKREDQYIGVMKENRTACNEKEPKEGKLIRVGRHKTQNEDLDAGGHFQTLLLHFLQDGLPRSATRHCATKKSAKIPVCLQVS